MTVNYGDRARIGMLLPSVNRAAEPQISEMLPDGVSLHTTRLRLLSSKEEHINEMVDDVERGAMMLADADVDLIVFHCTAASMFAGLESLGSLSMEMTLTRMDSTPSTGRQRRSAVSCSF